MRLIDIALKGMGRRPGRVLLLVIGLAIGVATVVALVAITTSMNQSMATKLDEYGANILIVPRSNDLALSYGGVSVASASFGVTEMNLDDLERIGTIPNAQNVSVVAPKLLSAVNLGERQILLAGVQFENELRLKQWWQVTGSYPSQAHDALAGARLAEEMQLEQGQMIDIQGQKFTIAGILSENGSQDDHILFVDLALAQQLLGQPGRITLAEVAALCSECPIEEMVSQISEVLPQMRVTALRQAVTLRMETVGQLTRFALAVSLVVTAIGGLIVVTTMLGAVAERRQEIGLFRALGLGSDTSARSFWWRQPWLAWSAASWAGSSAWWSRFWCNRR